MIGSFFSLPSCPNYGHGRVIILPFCHLPLIFYINCTIIVLSNIYIMTMLSYSLAPFEQLFHSMQANKSLNFLFSLSGPNSSARTYQGRSAPGGGTNKTGKTQPNPPRRNTSSAPGGDATSDPRGETEAHAPGGPYSEPAAGALKTGSC